MNYRYILWMHICHLRRGNGGKENCKALFQILSSLYFRMFPCFGDNAPFLLCVVGKKDKHKKVSPDYPF